MTFGDAVFAVPSSGCPPLTAGCDVAGSVGVMYPDCEAVVLYVARSTQTRPLPTELTLYFTSSSSNKFFVLLLNKE